MTLIHCIKKSFTHSRVGKRNLVLRDLITTIQNIFFFHAVFRTYQERQRQSGSLVLRHSFLIKKFRSPLSAGFWMRCVLCDKLHGLCFVTSLVLEWELNLQTVAGINSNFLIPNKCLK